MQTVNEMKTSKIRIGFGLYLFYLLAMTLAPFQFSFGRFLQFIHSDSRTILGEIYQFSPLDFFNNILLFLPFGFLMFFILGGTSIVRKAKKTTLTVLLGTGLSAILEFTQLFVPHRDCTVNDVAMNALGTFLGYLMASKWQEKGFPYPSFLHRIVRSLKPVWIGAYAIGILTFSLVPSRINDFGGWDVGYPLLIGNEATGDRPWRGCVARIGICDRALGAREVRILVKSGLRNSAVGMHGFPADEILFFPLNEGTSPTNQGGPDTLYGEGSGPDPLHLSLSGSFEWMNPLPGIRVDGHNPPRSIGSAARLARALKRTSQMTLSLWLKTEDVRQYGPARIFTMSQNPNERNFSLVQDGDSLVFRVRTRQAGPNGSRICPTARDVFLDREWHHVAAVFNRGYGRIFVDGKPAGSTVRVPDGYLFLLFGMGGSLLLRLLLWTGLLLPFGFLCSSVFRRRRLIAGAAACLILYGLIQLLQYIYLGQPFGF